MTILNSLKKHTATFSVLLTMAMVSFNSFAEYTQVSALITGDSDCGKNKYFYDEYSDSNGFSACRIFADNNGTTTYLSDVISKFDTNNSLSDSTFTASSQYSGSEYADIVNKDNWAFTDTSSGDSTGTWTYNNGVHTYPDIRFWVAKAGNAFRLFWLIADNTPEVCIAGNESQTDDNLNYDCMNAAISVTTGSWITPTGGNGNRNLSHITFFGGLCTGPECGAPVVVPVPEPTTLAILALGLLGLTVRRKQTSKAIK